MKNLKNIAIHTVTYGLLLALFFPAATELSHLFEDHEHTFCGNVSTHLHEQDLDCDLTKFISTVFYNDKPSFTISTQVPNRTTLIDNYVSVISKRLSQSIYLRGPPAIQHTS